MSHHIHADSRTGALDTRTCVPATGQGVISFTVAEADEAARGLVNLH